MKKNITAVMAVGTFVFFPLLSSAQVQTNAEVRVQAEVNAEVNQKNNRNIPPVEREQLQKKREVIQTTIAEKQERVDTSNNKRTSTSTMNKKNVQRVEAYSENKAEFKAEIEVRKKALSQELEKRRAERKDALRVRLAADAKERVLKHLTTIYNRLSDRIEKIASLDIRIAARINAVAEAGGNVERATEQYEKAKEALEKAKTDLEATQTLSTEATETETSKETLRTLVKTAEESIRITVQEYMKVISLLRPSITNPNLTENDDQDTESEDDDSEITATTTSTTTASTTIQN